MKTTGLMRFEDQTSIHRKSRIRVDNVTRYKSHPLKNFGTRLEESKVDNLATSIAMFAALTKQKVKCDRLA